MVSLAVARPFKATKKDEELVALAQTCLAHPEFEPLIVTDPVETAKQAGLRYTNDQAPGIRRKRAGKHFSYVDKNGQVIRDPRVLERIKKLAIPPAWTDVWICPQENCHLQATGRDARGRKQYRYHPHWRAVRDETKYHRMLAFGKALPAIRERVNQDLSLPGLTREKVLATVVRLLEETLIRVGNEEYARQNDSYGLTTLRNSHVDVNGSELRFHFVGKSGVKHDVGVRDPRVARVIKRLRELPGHHLFEYIDEAGSVTPIGSHDVNDYLREISGDEFSSKDFRTWAGTLLAAEALEAFPPFESQTEAKHNVVLAIERVAERLGNTPSVSRNCYVHPEVINAYMEGETVGDTRARLAEQGEASPPGLSSNEAALVEFLKLRLLS